MFRRAFVQLLGLAVSFPCQLLASRKAFTTAEKWQDPLLAEFRVHVYEPCENEACDWELFNMAYGLAVEIAEVAGRLPAAEPARLRQIRQVNPLLCDRVERELATIRENGPVRRFARDFVSEACFQGDMKSPGGRYHISCEQYCYHQQGAFLGGAVRLTISRDDGCHGQGTTYWPDSPMQRKRAVQELHDLKQVAVDDPATFDTVLVTIAVLMTR